MQIDKVSHKGDSVSIEYTEELGNGLSNHYKMEYQQRALPSFYQRFNQLAEFVAEILELPDEYVEGLEVRAVHFTRSEEQGKGVVFTAVKKLKSGRMYVINTPYAPEVPKGSKSDFQGCLTTACVEKVNQVEEEAIAYIGGARLQGELFDDNKKKKSGVRRKNVHTLKPEAASA